MGWVLLVYGVSVAAGNLWGGRLADRKGAIPALKIIFTALAGALVSYYATPSLSARIGMPEGLTGFLLGLFGMAVMSRGWEWVQTTPVAAIWQIVLDWMQRRSGGSK